MVGIVVVVVVVVLVVLVVVVVGGDGLQLSPAQTISPLDAILFPPFMATGQKRCESSGHQGSQQGEQQQQCTRSSTGSGVVVVIKKGKIHS